MDGNRVVRSYWTSPGQFLAFTRRRKSDGVGSLPVEVGRMSQAVKVTIRPSFENTYRFSPPNPRAIHTRSEASGSLNNHQLKPYMNSFLNCGSGGAWKYGVTDSFTHSLETIRCPSHMPSCKYK